MASSSADPKWENLFPREPLTKIAHEREVIKKVEESDGPPPPTPGLAPGHTIVDLDNIGYHLASVDWTAAEVPD